MRKLQQIALGAIGLLLVLFQIFGSNLNAFSSLDVDYDTVLSQLEEQSNRRETVVLRDGDSVSVEEEEPLRRSEDYDIAKTATIKPQEDVKETTEKVSTIPPPKAPSIDDTPTIPSETAPIKDTTPQVQAQEKGEQLEKKALRSSPEQEKEKEADKPQKDKTQQQKEKETKVVAKPPPATTTKPPKPAPVKIDVVIPGEKQGPLLCNNNNECCASWEIDSDEWWTQHPDWEISRETTNEYCFRPNPNLNRTQFLRQLHAFQWRGDNCDQLMKSCEMNSGYGASTVWVLNAFYQAYVLQQKPFNIAVTKRHWIYSVQDPKHPLYCPEMDSRCYYLPISACTNRTETIPNENYGLKKMYRERIEYFWMRQYLYRPKQAFRKLLFEFRQTIPLQLPCTALHVRRSDAGFPRQPFRRYAAVQEYLDIVPNLNQGDNLLVLTDDQTVIDEIHKYLKDDYNWTYVDRERNRGISGGFNGHVPSDNGALELLVMHVEWTLARQCQKLVYGESGFMKNFLKELELEGLHREQFVLDVEVRQSEARAWNLMPQKRVDHFFQDIDQFYLDRGMVAKNVPTTWKGDLLPPTEIEITGTEKLVTCTSNPDLCCGTWDVNADAWWLHKPDWAVRMENDTHFCFAPLKNETHREFLRKVHEVQWGGDCKNVSKTVVVNSGFASSISWEVLTFFYAWRYNTQYQLIDHRRHWLYAPHDKSSWAYCESADSRCYYLPVGRCSRKETIPGEHHDARPKRGEKAFWQLLKKYNTRPNQEFRRRVYEMKKTVDLRRPCTTIHVRRGDSGVPAQPFRRYAAVQEYLDAGEVKEGSTVFLMTDDDSTLVEIKKHLAEKYKFVYLEKARSQNVDAVFDMHIASGDEALEMVAIAAEQELASTCQKFVHGKSGFSKSLVEDIEFARENVKVYYLDTEVTKEEAMAFKSKMKERPAKFLQDIEEFYQRRAKEEPKKNAPEKPPKAVDVTAKSVTPITTIRPDEKNIASPTCMNTREGRRCCGGWDENYDEWWIHRPTWEISTLNETTQCFQPMKNVNKAAYLKRVYNNQWHGDCEQVVTSTQINSGYSASTNFLAYTFLNASIEGKPFQVTRHDFPWLYAPTSKSSWAYCEAKDISCYILPLSNCERDFVPEKDLTHHVKHHRVFAEPKTTQKDKTEFAWLKQYMMRPTQELRRHLMLIVQQVNLTTPCTMIHVRRSDAGIPDRPFRRFAAVQEYLDIGDVEEGETILLLTDDQTTIDEVNTYHQNYHWVYTNRTRHNGITKWQDHIPSGDHAFEVAVIEAETYLASQCSKVVHGQSGFMKYVLSQMVADGKTFESFFVNTAVTKDVSVKEWPQDIKERMKFFLKEMEEYRKRSNEEKQETGQEDSESEVEPNTVTPEAEVDKDGPMTCTGHGDDQECCASWDVAVDEWWTHKPTWEISKETKDTQCFAPIARRDKEKAAYYQKVYELQWNGDCSATIASTQANSNYGASTLRLAQTFLNATLENRPFQIAKHDVPWLYGPKKGGWSYCKSEDIACFILPLSKCGRVMVHDKDRQAFTRYSTNAADDERKRELQWLKDFMLRPNQVMRQKRAALKSEVNLATPCTTLHIRRGDAGLPKRPHRRYASVQEYLDVGEVEEGSNVLLLTDDQTTIDEVNLYHNRDYQWFYLKRDRNSAISGAGLDAASYVPSGDGGLEVLAILTEIDLAMQCSKIVHGTSGFIRSIYTKMATDGVPYSKRLLNTLVTKEEAAKWRTRPEARIKYFIEQMDEYRKKSKASKKEQKAAASGAAAGDTSKVEKKRSYTSPVACTGEGEALECCASWDVNVDNWWTHKPTWAVSKETDTLQCFAPMKDPEKIKYFQHLYDTQWKSDCSRLVSSIQVNSGYGSGTNWLAKTFFNATTDGNPFQILLHDKPWIYGPTDNSSWAWCDSQDITCFILPLSKCDRQFVARGRPTSQYPRIAKEPDKHNNPKEAMQFLWLREFMLRPNQKFRWEQYKMRKSINLTTPCTTMHVRRGDAGLPRYPYRRYAAVQEYLDLAEVEKGDTILLLTDDQTTIDEINKFHKKYNWVYVNRTRTNGVDGGWESHIPSGDGPFEVLVIETETYLAGLCEKIVHGKSGFMQIVRGAMERDGKQYQAYVLNTNVGKTEAKKWPADGKERVEYFMKEMKEYRKKSAENKKKKKKEDQGEKEIKSTEEGKE